MHDDATNEDLLIRFCRDVDAAIRTNGSDAPWFDRSQGLCHNLQLWTSRGPYLALEEYLALAKYLHKIFYEIVSKEGRLETNAGAAFIPFNSAIEEYWDETANITIFHNIKRLTFVNEWAAKPLQEGMKS